MSTLVPAAARRPYWTKTLAHSDYLQHRAIKKGMNDVHFTTLNNIQKQMGPCFLIIFFNLGINKEYSCSTNIKMFNIIPWNKMWLPRYYLVATFSMK